MSAMREWRRSRWRGRQPQAGLAPTRPAPLGLALVLGVIAFLVIRGPATLDPTNILWLGQNDRAMHTLGWWYFMAAPWGWPPGGSPLNGLEFANGIGLADGLPLFAFPFKLIAPWLPRHFQYWGWWHLVSFALQAMFAALVAHRLGMSRPLALVAALFCLVQPAFLARVDVHMALAGHWTILASIALYLRPAPPRAYAWPLLLGVVAAVHGYLLAMVAVIWLASLWRRAVLGELRLGPVVGEMVGSSVAVATVLWAAGIFMVGSTASFGFGAFRMNLLGPFNPDGWSALVPSVVSSFAEWEGFNYLGLGVAVLLAIGLVAGWRDIARLFGKGMLPLVIAVVGLAVFSLSTRVALGAIELVSIPLPEALERVAGTFRSSGRMFWPMGYLLIFAAIALVSRHLTARAAVAVGLAALLIQVGDTQRGWRGLYVGAERTGARWDTPLTSPLWAALALHYARLRALPVENGGEHWRDLTALAEGFGMGTDAANLGRVDPQALAAAQAAGWAALATGGFDAEAIYVIAPDLVDEVAAQVRAGDLFGTIDGLVVFARGGAAFAPGVQPAR